MRPGSEFKKKILEDILGQSYDAYVNFKREPFLPKKRQHRQRIPLWRFILHLLHLDKCQNLIEWNPTIEMEFRIKDPAGVASLWGSIKDKQDMTYEKLGRAMRYYYGKNIIEKVAGKRYSYKFILSRKTKKYIEQFPRRSSTSSAGSFESDETSSFSEDQSDIEIKIEECKSPESGCTESTNDSEEYQQIPDLDLCNGLPEDFWDFSLHDMITPMSNALNISQDITNFLSNSEIKQDLFSNLEDAQATAKISMTDTQIQEFHHDILLDIKPLNDFLFQSDSQSTPNFHHYFN